MEIKSAIIHKITKHTGESPSLQLKDTELDTSFIEEFVVEIKKNYYERSSKYYGTFEDDDIEFPFQRYLQQNHGGTTTFIEFSKQTANHLFNTIKNVNLATGAYLLMVRVEDIKDFLIIALLNDKYRFTINETLDLTKSLILESEKINLAVFVNLCDWEDGEDSYLSFAKGRKDIADYFIKFMGCKKLESTEVPTTMLLNKSKEYLDIHFGAASEDIYHCLLINTLENATKGKSISLENISHIIDPENHDRYLEFITNEEYKLNSEFTPHKATVYSKLKIVYKDRHMSLSFDRNYIRDKVEIIDNDLLIKNIPAKLKEEIISEISNIEHEQN